MELNNKFKIGVLIYTHNRVDDARINMEIVKNVWEASGLFESIKIVHCFNGQKSWYPNKYLEDILVRIENTGHFQGASELIDTGVAHFKDELPDLDYLVVLAADTWLVKPEYINNIFKEMKRKKLYWSTCSWFSLPGIEWSVVKGPASDFFVLDYEWLKKSEMFPLDYKNFAEKYADLFYSQGGPVTLERLFFSRYLRAIHKQTENDAELLPFSLSKIHVMKDREPVHIRKNKEGLWIRRMFWSGMGLLTHHKPAQKRKILKELRINKGRYIQKLLNAKSLKYYNQGFVSYQKGN